MEKRDAYIEKMHAQIDELDARIDELSAKAEKSKADAKIDLQRKLDTLRDKRKEVGEQMDALRNASQKSWSDVKTGFERAWGEFKGSVEDAAAHFR